MANELMQFGNWGNAASTHGQTWMGIYREYLGYFVEPCTNDEYEAIVARDDVAAMPMYPRAGSITPCITASSREYKAPLNEIHTAPSNGP